MSGNKRMAAIVYDVMQALRPVTVRQSSGDEAPSEEEYCEAFAAGLLSRGVVLMPESGQAGSGGIAEYEAMLRSVREGLREIAVAESFRAEAAEAQLAALGPARELLARVAACRPYSPTAHMFNDIDAFLAASSPEKEGIE